MLKLAIVEDDIIYRNELKAFISHYEKETGQIFQISEFVDGDEILENYKSDYDIILMDVEMRFVDGMTAAEEIRKVDSDTTIIFITNMPQYAIRGYTVGALDYILKPVNYYAFSQTLTRAIGRRTNTNKKYLSVKIKGGVQKIDISRVRYIEVMDHDLIFHTLDGEIHSKGSISKMEELLKDDYFFLCNKAFLINLAFVDAIQNSDAFIGDDVIQVSRAKKKMLIDAVNNYMSEMGR